MDVQYQLEDLPSFTSELGFASLVTTAGSPTYAENLCLGPGAMRLSVTQVDALGRAAIGSGSQFLQAGDIAGTTVYVQAA